MANQPNLGAVFVDLLPLMVAAALVPAQVAVVLLLLSRPGGLLKGAAFVSGAVTLRLAQGVVFGFILAGDPAAEGDAGGKLLVSTLLLVVGILLLITAFRKWNKEEDPDAPPPRWIAMLDGLSAPKAFGVGMGLVLVSAKHWVFTLSAIAVIAEARLAPPPGIGLFVCYVLAAQALGLIAVIGYAAAPQRAGRVLAGACAWLERNDRPIGVAASSIFGLFFVFKGITGY